MSAFLYIEGIQGEASDAGFKNWIDISQWHWGVSRAITSHTATQGDRESSNPTITDLTLTRFMDKATAPLFIESCCGTGKTAKLVQTKTGTGSGSNVFVEHTFYNALISRYHTAALANAAARPREEITLSFVEVDTRYTPYDNNGLPQAPIAVGFNTATNIKK